MLTHLPLENGGKTADDNLSHLCDAYCQCSAENLPGYNGTEL